MDKPSIADLFGKDDEDSEYEGAEDSKDAKSDLPEDYRTAYEEFEESPSAETFWRAVEACVDNSDSYGKKKPGGTGLLMLLGGKPKRGK